MRPRRPPTPASGSSTRPSGSSPSAASPGRRSARSRTRPAANLGAVNYYFRSKENLYAEVFARRAALLREPIGGRGQGGRGHRPRETRTRRSAPSAASSWRRTRTARRVPAPARPLRAGDRSRRACRRASSCGSSWCPTIEAITGVVRQVRPDLPEAVARACAHSFFAQLMHIVKGAGAAVGVRGRAARARRALHGGGRPSHRGRPPGQGARRRDASSPDGESE